MYRKFKDSFTCFNSQRSQRQSEGEAGIGSAAAIISSVSGAIESDRVQLAQEREFYRQSSSTTMHSFGRKPSKALLSSEDDDLDDSEDSFESSCTDNEISSDETPNWITIEDGKGGIKHIQTRTLPCHPHPFWPHAPSPTTSNNAQHRARPRQPHHPLAPAD